MTTQKKLKRAVRTRMAHTGERYAAARRMIAGSADDAPQAIDGGSGATALTERFAGLLPGYGRTGGPLPEVSPLANALAAAGVTAPHTGEPCSEALLYGLGGGVGGGYFLVQYQGAPSVAVIGTRNLWQDPAAFLAGILARLPVAHRVVASGGRKAADAAIDGALAAGQPALAWVDRAALPHSGLPAEYRKYQAWVVGVAGRDPASGAILLDDRAGVPLPIEPDALSEARGLITSSRRRLVIIEGPTGPGEAAPAGGSGGVDALAATVREAILDGHRQRTAPRIRNFGLPGLAKWADHVADTKDPKAWPQALVADVDLIRVLRWAFEAIGSGATPTSRRGADRGLYADFLDEAAGLPGLAGLAEVAPRYRKLAAGWAGLATALLPDAIPSLARLRALEAERWAAFDDPAGPDLERFRELTAVVEADATHQLRALLGGAPDGQPAFEVPATDRRVLFDELAARIREIHAGEIAATEALAAAAAG